MFAVVRTGGKQYRVAPGDKIVVEKLAGEAGETVSLGDVLLAGEGSELKSTEGLTVSAEIIAQAKADKVIVFKKRRRHNYRRKNGHRQRHTILRITAIGEHGIERAPASVEAQVAPEQQQPEPQVDTLAAAQPAPAATATEATAPKKRSRSAQAPASTEAHVAEPLKIEGAESQMTDSPASAKSDTE